MKRIYLVRHGETDANRDSIVQGPNNELSVQGRKQALKVAERSLGIDFEKIISSDYTRAKQTAQAIADANNMEVEESSLFQERRNPTCYQGELRSLPEYQEWQKAEEENKANPDWHFEDGENPWEFNERAKKALSFLADQKEENILVVTHGLFLRVFVARILAGELCTPELSFRMTPVLQVNNTGITVCTFDEGNWKLLTWNDHAHFAE